MKFISAIFGLLKKKSACVIPSLAFESHKIKRDDRCNHAVEKDNAAFAAAYLDRVRKQLSEERRGKIPCRRALKEENPCSAADELDAMIEDLMNLRGLNVTEREFYARPFKR
mgnify:CR=1 FL=1